MAVCCSLPLAPASNEGPALARARRARQWLQLGIAGLLASQTMIVSLALNLSVMVPSSRLILQIVLIVSTLGIFALVGFPLAREGWNAARRGRVVLEQLFLLGILGAFGASLTATLTGQGSVYYEVVSILLSIYLFGKLLAEERQRNVERAAFRINDQFGFCRRLLAGREEMVLASSIVPGDEVVVRPGESIGLDGEVISGCAYVQETPLTGEPFPVIKRIADRILAGSEVIDSPLTIRATVAGGSRQLDELLARVRRAHRGASPIQQEADRLMRWFLPIVVSVSMLTLVYWWRQVPWPVALFRSMSVLLVACPCAMGLATPIALWGGLSALVRRGWQVHSSDLLERLARIDTVVFDKTGTLSEEHLRMMDFVAFDSSQRSELLTWTRAVQHSSNHPVARAFHAASGTPPGLVVDWIEVLPAIGLAAQISRGDGPRGSTHRLEIGNAGLLNQDDRRLAAGLRTLHQGGAATHEVWIKLDGQLAALAFLQERLRLGTTPALEKLRRAGIDLVIMTGDTHSSAVNLGFPLAQASLSPQDKADRVRDLQQQGRHVLFVGDGLNDAAALSESHAGLTAGHAPELAQSSSQATVLNLNWESIPEALEIARQTVRGIRFNLWFAAVYNLVGMGLAATGYLHPVAAALLMLFASATVTIRALHFAENLETTRVGRPVPPWARLRKLAQSLTWSGQATIAGFFLQALLLIHLSTPGWQGTAVILGASLGFVSLAFVGWPLINRTPLLQMTLGMLSIGNLGMLLGWWWDNGFNGIISDGHVRACCLAISSPHVEWSSFSRMQWGMIAASLPFMLWINDPEGRLLQSPSAKTWHALGGSMAMILGMSAIARLFQIIPMFEPRLYFYLFYAAMTVGMMLGMFAFCGIWRLFLFSRNLWPGRSVIFPAGR